MMNNIINGSFILDQLSVSADISDPLSVTGISAKFHIGASLILVNVWLSLINTHSGMQRSAMPKGRPFAQTLPRRSCFIEGSGSHTSYTQAVHTGCAHRHFPTTENKPASNSGDRTCIGRVPVKMLTHYTNSPPYLC